MNKKEKINSVDLAKDIFANNNAIILLTYKSLNALDTISLRKKLKSKKGNLKILKNTLVKRAIENSDFGALKDNLRGRVAISFSNDPVSLSNIVVGFSDSHDSLEIKIGFMDGKVLEIETIKSLASLGSIDEVRAKFIGLLQAPGSKLARTLNVYHTKLIENTAN